LGHLGLETHPAEFIDHLVAIFMEVHRVLRPDGTVWLNVSDSYVSAKSRFSSAPQTITRQKDRGEPVSHDKPDLRGDPVLKEKDMALIPHRLAIALQGAGWYVRSDIQWCKVAPMPASVTDRPTCAHEHIFLLAKSERYYYDADAVREPNSSPEQHAHNQRYAKPYAAYDDRASDTGQPGNVNNVGIHARPGTVGRNLRSVWTIPTHPFPEAHFATFPMKLVEPCIKAGSSEHGVCGACLAPWRRVVNDTQEYAELKQSVGRWGHAAGDAKIEMGRRQRNGSGPASHIPSQRQTTIGWQPTCTCHADIIPATVLDPFLGSGTTIVVASRLGRNGVGIELQPDYATMARQRINRGGSPLFAAMASEDDMDDVVPAVQQAMMGML